MKNRKEKKCVAALLCALVMLMLSGCQAEQITWTGDKLKSDTYPDAEKYQTGALTYRADEVHAIEVHWRSGEVEIIESDSGELHGSESGVDLPENVTMRWLLEDGVLQIRFCASGETVQFNPDDKHLRLEVPKGINLLVNTTAAPVKADALNQKELMITVFSGNIMLGRVTAEKIDFSSSSGEIRADSISGEALQCSTSSGAVAFDHVAVGTLACSTSSGRVTIDSMAAEKFNVKTSSGGVRLTLAQAATGDVHTSSSKVVLTLPEGGAAVNFTSSSGKLLFDGVYHRQGNLYEFGDGESQLTVQTSSGNLEVNLNDR